VCSSRERAQGDVILLTAQYHKSHALAVSYFVSLVLPLQAFVSVHVTSWRLSYVQMTLNVQQNSIFFAFLDRIMLLKLPFCVSPALSLSANFFRSESGSWSHPYDGRCPIGLAGASPSRSILHSCHYTRPCRVNMVHETKQQRSAGRDFPGARCFLFLASPLQTADCCF
jgi:hypothetical protein